MRMQRFRNRFNAFGQYLWQYEPITDLHSTYLTVILHHHVLALTELCCHWWPFVKRKPSKPGHSTIGLLPDTTNCGLRMRRECRERFLCHQLQRKSLVSDHGMHHVGIANPRWWGKRSRNSRRMRNPQFYLSGKRPIDSLADHWLNRSQAGCLVPTLKMTLAYLEISGYLTPSPH